MDSIRSRLSSLWSRIRPALRPRRIAKFLVVLFLGVALGLPYNVPPRAPFRSCTDAARTVQNSAAWADAMYADWANPKLATDPGTRSTVLSQAYWVLMESECDPDELAAVVNPATFRTDEMYSAWMSLLADVATQRDDFDDPPAEVAAAAELRQESPKVAPTSHATGDHIFLLATEPCDCFSQLLATAKADVSVVDVGPGSAELAEQLDLPLVSADDNLLTYVVSEYPAAVLTRSGRLISFTSGADAIAGYGEETARLIANPYDPSTEPADKDLVPTYATCDGNRWAVAAVNLTHRPVEMAVMFDVNDTFDDDGYPVPGEKWEVLGPLEPFSTGVWDGETGKRVLAPCYIDTLAWYTDADLRGTNWDVEGGLPQDLPDSAKAVADSADIDFPENVIPASGWPTPQDVTPLD